MKSHRISRVVELTQFQASAGGASQAAYTFQLSDLPSYTEFTALFDQYKFSEVEIRFLPVATVSSGLATAVSTQLYSTVDFDDGTAGSVSALQQYETCQVTPATQELTVRLAPRVALAAYAGAFTSYANVSSWLDVGSPSVQHYGFKVACNTENIVGATPQIWKVVCRYTIDFKSAR